ncbi:MAG: hypothetical protein KAU24_02870 [Candidatus Aenigmarchaeota archaeon]|nr:hypothetical protein [Candidatus Aenigmarchaeota archaeon]
MKINLKNNQNYNYSMSVKETIGAIVVLIMGLIIYSGIQLLTNSGVVGGTTISLSTVGIVLIIVGIVGIVWFVKSIL